MFSNIFHGKRVWLSGHTGFKGAWLSEWLLSLGAEVFGFALAPDTKPALFEQIGLDGRLKHEIGDIRSPGVVKRSLLAANPDFVFHLAAQPLVRRSYLLPVETYETNVMGTIHVMEALRELNHACTAVMVTTDKCYENREHGLPYSEEEHLGGRDPYSSSKAMAEIAIAAYRQSYFNKPGAPIRIASARAGNVIGGGDWAEDRIVPDCVRALQKREKIPVRNPFATRPWQHVLEPLSGYLWLAASLAQNEAIPRAFNFGPNADCNRSVGDLVKEILKCWSGHWDDKSDPNALHEAKLLNLSIKKATESLHWVPVWSLEQTIQHTMSWYHACVEDRSENRALLSAQIDSYCVDAKKLQVPWAS